MRRLAATAILLVLVNGAVAAAASAPRESLLQPIGARFVQAEFTTTYTTWFSTDLRASNVRYTWALTPPANDRDCKFFTKHASLPKREQGTLHRYQWKLMASWTHGDRHGCSHENEGPRGHRGVVTLTVTDGVWRCVATYAGTVTGFGERRPCARVGA